MLYPIGFLISFVALALWLLLQTNKRISPFLMLTFLAGLGSYLYGIFCAEAAFDVKWMSLSRDLILLATSVAFLSFFKKKTPLYLVLLAGMGFFAYQYYFSFMTSSLYESTAIVEQPLSKDAYVSEGELLLELKENSSVDKLQSIFEKYDLTARPAFQMDSEEATDLDDYVVVNVPDNRWHEMSAIMDAFRESKYVDWVEDNDVVQIAPIESDVINRKSPKYSVNDPDISKQWGLDQMAINDLHTYLTKNKIKPKKTARIAILDTGIDAQHEDIAANYKSIRKKYDTDGNAHGTHCAGIAAAVTNNGKGIASFTPNNEFVQVSSVRVLSGFGGGTQQGIINGILEAADAGVDVISMSLGGPSSSSRQKAYEKAIAYANKKGAIVLAAAGNSNKDAKNYTPANTPGIITVSAVDENLNRAVFSNYVQNVKMGIAAPGVNIFSTVPNNEYKSFNGTSMACPYAAGLVGLMKSIQPELTTAEVYKILNQTGKTTPAGKETGAFIQPAKAVQALFD